jgi:hypothetical protein
MKQGNGGQEEERQQEAKRREQRAERRKSSQGCLAGRAARINRIALLLLFSHAQAAASLPPRSGTMQ